MGNKKNGFSLIELLTVMVIIGVLAAMIFPNLAKVKIRARTAKAVSELKTIQLALMEYYAEYGGLPTNDVLPKPVKSGLYKLYEEDLLETAIADAFVSSQPYKYYSSDDGGDEADSCIVFSIGIDGKENNATDFVNALNDAYPDKSNLDVMPKSDNVYLFVNVNASRTDPLATREADIRYKK